jgi:hypothetical protein
MNTERPRHYFGFNCTVCETFVMTEDDEWACLCQRCYQRQQLAHEAGAPAPSDPSGPEDMR